MAVPRRRHDPADPVRRHLVEVRRGLLRLHKALIDSERRAYEQRTAPMTSGELLQALLHDEFFAWLRPFSGLIAAIDEALSGEEPVTPADARVFLDQALALVSPGEGKEALRFEAVKRRDPAVLFAHVEFSRTLAAAAGEGGVGGPAPP
jgi:hypothetical protein